MREMLSALFSSKVTAFDLIVGDEANGGARGQRLGIGIDLRIDDVAVDVDAGAPVFLREA